MKLGMSMNLNLRQKQETVYQPMLGLTALELELVLDKALEHIQAHADGEPAPTPEANKNGNYFFTKDFRELCRSAKGQIPQARYLERPQIFISLQKAQALARYNEHFNRILNEKLARFRAQSTDPRSAEEIFSKRFLHDRNWTITQQLRIAEYVTDVQSAYIMSNDPKDLKSITQVEVAEHLKINNSIVSRLCNNLTIQIQDGRVMFIQELMPGIFVPQRIAIRALQDLQKDPALYGEGKWKVSDARLSEVLKEKFGLDVARRTVNKYHALMNAE